ncbi:hypothetical protein Mal15_53260 [Stieleria maiorica]|uniref:Uncharacterized protein n=1 Tax=Stieleria maiorica TaxID=2795974 RepID=A0A5B9MLH3_9BACT|nr:hypothetical protein [Stieleria maiorica]QEG01250.1 hypothetical protein Mal15_53260 [Stieleria maiorica]
MTWQTGLVSLTPLALMIVPIISNSTDLSVEASVRINQGDSCEISLARVSESKFSGSFVPIANYRPADRLVEARIIYSRGEINAPLINQEFSIASQHKTLADTQRLVAQDDGTHRAIFVDGSETTGQLQGLDRVNVNFGSVRSVLNLSQAESVSLHLVDVRVEAEFTVVVRQSEEVVDQVVRRTSSISRELKPKVKLYDGEKRVLPMPAAITDIVIAGGGRRILVVMRHVKSIAVLDAVEGSIIKRLPLASDNILVAGTLNHIIIFDRANDRIERWSLNTLQKEASAKTPFSGVVKAVAAGYASDGPVLVHGDDLAASGSFSTLDVITLKEQAVRIPGERLLSTRGDVNHLRASANGTIFGMWATNQFPQGLNCLRLNGDRLEAYYEHKSVGHVCPGPGGMYLFTRTGGVYSNALKALSSDEKAASVPTTHEKMYVVVPEKREGQHPVEDNDIPVVRPYIRIIGSNTPLIDLPDLELGTESPEQRNEAAEFSLDKRVFYLVQAESLITIPFSNDKVVVQHYAIEKELKRTKTNYFYVASTPPRAFAPGESYRYQIDVVSNHPVTTYQLSSGPEGMEVSSSGELTWPVPSNFEQKSVDVIVTLTNSARQTRYDAFTLYPAP